MPPEGKRVNQKDKEEKMGLKICIDAGHFGKYNQSPAVKEYYESDMVWKLHLMQKKYLEEYKDVTVITTRQKQSVDKALHERGTCSKGCDLFISDHSNAVGSGVNETVDYVAVYHLTDDNTTQVDDISKEIAEKLAPVIANVMGVSQGWRVVTRKSGNDRNGDGQLNDNYYGVLHGARTVNAPGLIIEHGFHTNTKTTQWLLNNNNLERLAKAEVEILAAYFGLEKKGEASNTSANFVRIMGTALATAEQMISYIKRKNPDVAQSVLDMVPLYLSEGEAEGVRGDVAFAQSCLETGNFGFAGSAVTLDQNNFCGMGVTANGMKGNSFDTPQMGIRAQVQHLKAYASVDVLNNDCVDSRFQYVTRGCAEYVEWLGQKENPKGFGWATGAGYGEKILAILNSILAIGIESSPTESPEPEVWYRVRRAWDDAASQKGAFKVMDNAKACADENPGYSVFDEEGKVLYSSNTAFQPFLVRVNTSYLNIRKGPGTNHAKTGKYTGIGVFTIVKVQPGEGSDSGWGLLKSYAENEDGWISLDITERV